MMSFYEKLSMKLQGEGATATAKPVAASASRGVSYNAAGIKTQAAPPSNASAPAAADAPPAGAAQADVTPDGMDPLLVDLSQSETRMIVFAQVSGVAAKDLEVTADEESNTLLIQATQKRPATPLPPSVAPNAEPEKERFVKQEAKWGSFYRKVYLPEQFDSSQAQTFLDHGVLIVVLPIRKPGEGKKLLVQESRNEAPKQ